MSVDRPGEPTPRDGNAVGPAGAAPSSFTGRIVAALRRHPALCLLILSPGIPEYLSGSSPVAALALNPAGFALQLALNLGLYGPGVLLIRETMVRRRLGWPSLALLGAAYAIGEEGIALSTFFNPHAGPVGTLGFYGHFAGVNWVWAIGLVMFHAVYSIALPILLLSLALPEVRGRPLLSARERLVAAAILLVDVTVLMLLVARAEGFWMGVPILMGSIAAVSLLVATALRIRPATGSPPAPGFRESGLFVGGLILFPGTLVIESVLEYAHVPAAVTFGVVGGYFLLWALWYAPVFARPDDRRSLVVLSTGLLVPVLVIGPIAGWAFPLVLVFDGLMVLFLRRLWKGYPATDSDARTVQSGALLG